MRCQVGDCNHEAVVEYQPLEAGDSESWVGLNWRQDTWVPVCELHLKRRRIRRIRHPDGRMEILRQKVWPET